MSIRDRIREWLGITDMSRKFDQLARATADEVRMARAAASFSAAQALVAHELAEQVAAHKGVPQFHRIHCPHCSREYSSIALRGHLTSIACHCGAHFDVAPNGEVTKRA